jgi:hypothetical protein
MVYCYKVLSCASTYVSPCSYVMCMYLFIYCAVTLLFTYRIVSSMYSKYTVSIFRFLKLFLHNSRSTWFPMTPSIAKKFQYVNSTFLFFFPLTTCFGLYRPSSGENIQLMLYKHHIETLLRLTAS